MEDEAVSRYLHAHRRVTSEAPYFGEVMHVRSLFSNVCNPYSVAVTDRVLNREGGPCLDAVQIVRYGVVPRTKPDREALMHGILFSH